MWTVTRNAYRQFRWKTILFVREAALWKSYFPKNITSAVNDPKIEHYKVKDTHICSTCTSESQVSFRFVIRRALSRIFAKFHFHFTTMLNFNVFQSFKFHKPKTYLFVWTVKGNTYKNFGSKMNHKCRRSCALKPCVQKNSKSTEWHPNDLENHNVKCAPCMLHYYPGSQNFTPFHTVAWFNIHSHWVPC